MSHKKKPAPAPKKQPVDMTDIQNQMSKAMHEEAEGWKKTPEYKHNIEKGEYIEDVKDED